MTNTRDHTFIASGGSRIELPTLALGIVIYTAWILLTFFFHLLPHILVVCLGAALITLHSSFQHEVVHGHPTKFRHLNWAIGCIPLSLWLPFELYRRNHLRHHVNDRLTDPLTDPESKYFDMAQWADMKPYGRAIAQLQSTLLGWVIIGPLWSILMFLLNEMRRLFSLDLERARIWLHHLILVVPLVLWLVIVCHVSITQYLLLFVYPGTAILMLRGFAEHRAAEHTHHRSAIIETRSPLALLFLNNNYHAVHHKHPTVPWYELPGLYWRNRGQFLEENNHLVYGGYGEIVKRFLFKPHDKLLHPFSSVESVSASASDK